MLGKGRKLYTQLLVEFVGKTIEDEINEFLSDNPDVIVLDIKFAIMPNCEDSNEVYREALVIYKEDSPDAS